MLTLAGCIESNTVIKVNLDGSGEVEETFLMGTEMIQMIMGFAAKLEQKALAVVYRFSDITKLKVDRENG